MEAETERWPLWLRSSQQGGGGGDGAGQGGWPGEDRGGVKGGELYLEV